MTLAALVKLSLLLAVSMAGGAAWGADAPARVFRVGFVSAGRLTPGEVAKELERYGYVEGKNLAVEVRAPEAAADLADLKLDVIVAVTNPSAFAAQRATRATPIVVWGAHGALETGLVSSLRTPGGNLTGVESMATELDAKRMELLKEIVPTLARVGVIYDAGDQGSAVHLKSTMAAAQVLGVKVSVLEVRRAEDFRSALATAAGDVLGGMLTYTGQLTFANWKEINDFALAKRLPTLCEFRELTHAGCLLSYGTTRRELTERTAALIDRILKGAAPGDLPVERVTRFELVVNLKTAKAIGVTIPQSVLLRADEVIQ